MVKITGERHYIDIELDGRTARFEGELCIDGFAADAASMRWLPPHEKTPPTHADREEFVNEVLKEQKESLYKVFFSD